MARICGTKSTHQSLQSPGSGMCEKPSTMLVWSAGTLNMRSSMKVDDTPSEPASVAPEPPDVPVGLSVSVSAAANNARRGYRADRRNKKNTRDRAYTMMHLPPFTPNLLAQPVQWHLALHPTRCCDSRQPQIKHEIRSSSVYTRSNGKSNNKANT